MSSRALSSLWCASGFHFGERLGTDQGTDRDRLCRIEHLRRFERREERVHVRLHGKVDALERVRQDEAVDAYHDRHAQLLGQAEGNHVQVRGLLVRLGEELDPSGVAQRHGVGVVVPDVDGRADGPRAERHHDRQPEPGRVVEGLCHVEETLARSGRVGACACRRRADGDAQRGELRLDVDERAMAQSRPSSRSRSRPSTM